MRGLHDRFISVHLRFLLNGNAYAISASSDPFFPLNIYLKIYFNYFNGWKQSDFCQRSDHGFRKHGKFEIRIIRHRTGISYEMERSSHVTATIRMRLSSIARIYFYRSWREVVPFYRPGTDGEIFVVRYANFHSLV